MSLSCFVGPEGNVLEEQESHCHRLKLDSPLLSTPQFLAISSLEGEAGWRSKVLHPYPYFSLKPLFS